MLFYLTQLLQKEKMEVIMVTREQIINAVTIAAEKYPILACYLFGSYSRGEETETSDVDLIIDLPKSGITYITLESIQMELSEELGVSVDLKTIGALEENPLFFKYIEDDLIELFNKNSNQKNIV